MIVGSILLCFVPCRFLEPWCLDVLDRFLIDKFSADRLEDSSLLDNFPHVGVDM